jgi:aconitate hydratase
MAPEYGATCGLFPIDDETLDFLRLTGRSDEQVALVEAYCQGPGHVRRRHGSPSRLSETWSWTSAPSCRRLAGPKRPQDRIALTDQGPFEASLKALKAERKSPARARSRPASTARRSRSATAPW